MPATLNPPPIAPPLPQPAGLEDFRSLGISAEENRPEVIRQALRNVAAPLVRRTQKKHLTYLEDQLAAVLSAGYRALDPRLRLKVAERVSLSLIDPSPPRVTWAPWAKVEQTSEGMLDRLEVLRTFTFLRDQSRWRRFTRRPHGLVIAACVLAMFLIAGTLVTVRRTDKRGIQTSTILTNQTRQRPTATSLPRSIQVDAQPDTEPANRSPSVVPVIRDTRKEVGSANDVDQPRATVLPIAVVAQAPIQVPSPEPKTPAAESTPSKSVDPTPAVTATPEKKSAEVPEAPAKPMVVEPTMPRDEDLGEARRKLDSVERGQPRGFAERIARLRRLYDSASDFSADRYVLLETLLDDFILNHQLSDALQTIDQITEAYPVSQVTVASAAAERTAAAASSLTQHERVVDWSLRTAEMGVRTEAFDAANETLRIAGIAVMKTSSKELNLRVRTVRDGVASAKRSRIELADEVAPDDVDAAKANQRGRYLCLFLNDWQRGLPWLVRCSDAKLARAAKLDLEGKSDEALKAYFEEAKTMRGRPGESLRLHSLELLRQQLDAASGLDAEQLRQRIAGLESELAVDLITPVKRTAPVASATKQPATIAPLNDTTGLLGRLRVAGRDVGALIRYPGEIGLGPNELTQILSQLGVQQVIDVDLEFLGGIQIPTATTVALEVRGHMPPEGKTIVEIDGRAIGLEWIADRFVAKVDLAPGVHRLRWRVTGKSLGMVSMAARDDRDATKLVLNHDPQTTAALTNGLATRLNVRIGAAPQK